MRIVRYITRDSAGAEYESVKAYIHHGRTLFNGAHILENPERGSLLTVSARVVDVPDHEIDSCFSPEVAIAIGERRRG